MKKRLIPFIDRRSARGLTSPAFRGRMLVLAAGLLIALGLGYIVNGIRMRTETKKSGEDNQDS